VCVSAALVSAAKVMHCIQCCLVITVVSIIIVIIILSPIMSWLIADIPVCGCQDIEKELELQIGMKQEVEIAMRLLEKDAHDKQELVASLRKQLEDVKNMNIEMHNRLQVSRCNILNNTTPTQTQSYDALSDVF